MSNSEIMMSDFSTAILKQLGSRPLVHKLLYEFPHLWPTIQLVPKYKHHKLSSNKICIGGGSVVFAAVWCTRVTVGVFYLTFISTHNIELVIVD